MSNMRRATHARFRAWVGRAVAAFASAAMALTLADAAVASVGFRDVSAGTPHVVDIEWLVDRGIAKGYADGSFGGMRTVVRQDMAAFLYRMAGSPAYAPSAADWKRFRDVRPDTPHAKEVLWLASMGIAQGYSDGTFGGMRDVVRQDMAAFLRRFADRFPKRVQVVRDAEAGFRDVTAQTPHAADITWLARTNVSQGYEDGTFGGMRTVVRQDMAAFLHRLAVHEKAYTVNAAIRVYWQSQGGAAGWIGRPLSDGVTSSDGSSVTQRFQRATITAGLGQELMLGSVKTRWTNGGGASGALGGLTYPLVVRVNGGMSFQPFDRGIIVATSDTDAKSTHVLDQDYAAAWLGAFASSANGLGKPTGERAGSVNGGSHQTFAGGTIYRRAGSGQAVAVSGDWLGTYSANGGEGGVLGYPIGVVTGSARDGGRYQAFEHGTIYWSASTGMHAVYGDWFRNYASHGYELAELGYPTAGVRGSAKDGGRYQTFQHGTIYWSHAGGTHAVYGAMMNRYAGLGYEFGIHGFPTSDQYDDRGVGRQNFQRGFMWAGDAPKGQYLHGINWVGQETNYWCVPASTVMALTKAGRTRSARGEALSQSLLANTYFHASPAIGVWYRNVAPGINDYLGADVYTSYVFPSSADARKEVLNTFETDYPAVVEADERRGGPHLNGHNNATFGHEYAIDGIDTNTNQLLLVDPGASGAVWSGIPQKFWVNLDWFLNNFVRSSVFGDAFGISGPRY